MFCNFFTQFVHMGPGPLHIGDQGQVCPAKTCATEVACINLCISILVNLQFIGYKLIALRHCVTPAKLGL